MGQIPRLWSETELLELFSQFGAIFDLQILNDRITGQSRGCAFVTFQLNERNVVKNLQLKYMKTMLHSLCGMVYMNFEKFSSTKSAYRCIEKFHGIKILPGMSNPLQIRPADIERRSDRRLFIGLLPISFEEKDIRAKFEKFGKIQEVQVLRNSNGTSKRCAFLTYSK